ncbi:hypothetical protein QFC20_007111 [Naganishia adeliensis]|uniref:Uncharacterized protein n=1 Tax=Naganishia adeliensis TaxID=92952 RepID=A0ACC2V336_9TREE|nr:hypothetical protein QFC20_007111 [Naganishia adeliensis]
MAGFNSTIFAYGQTGSEPRKAISLAGLIPREHDIQIYNETLRDILQPTRGVLIDKDKPVLHVIEGSVVVRPLKEEIVRTPEEVLGLLERGQKNRRTGATDWNERSSRSHCVFTMTIESRLGADVRQSRLTLIDLAGSEKAASNLERLAEGKHINRSLLALGTVIELLSDKNRRPKLTHLLENALGGNANIAVICTLSAETHHCSETLESLKFASRCAQVETQAIQGIVAASEKALLQSKEEEILELREQIQMLTNTRPQEPGPIPSPNVESEGRQQILHQELENLKDRRKRLVDQLKSLNSEILSSQSSQTSGTAAAVGLTMRRRVSDFIRMHPQKTPLGADPATPSRRAVSAKITTIDEEDDDDQGLSGDMIRALQRQRSADKENHSLLLSRLAKAEEAALQAETTRREIEDLKQRLAEETARSEGLMQQLMGRDRFERGQNEVILELQSQVAAARAETIDLEVIRTKLSEPASLPLVNEAGLPIRSDSDPGLILQKLSLPSDMSLPRPLQCSECQRHLEKSRKHETIIQGQQSINRALMEKVANWQKRVSEQDDLIHRLLPKLRIQEKENAAPVLTDAEVAQKRTSPDKKTSTVGPAGSHKNWSPQKPHLSQSPSKPYLYSERPRPLPMTETQESNFPTQGRRRVTIEHDINRLQSLSRVDKTRGLFASAERLP